jgi:Flp pilus assembly pilin Flp
VFGYRVRVASVLNTKDSLALPIWRFYNSRMNHLQRFLRDEQGQDLVEYTLLVAFVALASAATFTSAGASLTGIWGNASNQLSNAASESAGLSAVLP